MVNWSREDREDKPPIYWYASPPAPIALDGLRVQQKGRVFYVVPIAAHDIDRLCSVPAIQYESTNADVANNAITAYIDRWQRELDPSRTLEISKFFSQPNNFLVNAAVIGLPKSVNFHTNQQSRSTTTIAVNWTKQKCPVCGWSPPAGHVRSGNWFDACPSCTWDGRPGKIIDGQHRIRGCARAGPPSSGELLVASILLGEDFSLTDEAKIFSEITTSATDLHTLHKIFLLYKFGLRGVDVGDLLDADFRAEKPPLGVPNTLGTRNRRAFEIACHLVSGHQSRWSDRISMFPGPEGHARKGDVINSDSFVYFVERWLADGPLSDPTSIDGMLSTAKAADRLSSFLEAALAMWPTGGTPLGTSSSFWEDSRLSNGWLQLRGIFEVFLTLFEITSRRLIARGANLELATYTEELSYIEAINWDSPAWHKLAAPDKNKELLKRVLRHLYSQAASPVGAARVPAGVNAWIGEKPDEIKFDAPLPLGTTMATAAPISPISFGWTSASPFVAGRIPKPINAYETAQILMEQEQKGKTEVLEQVETLFTKWRITEPPRGLDTSATAKPVRVTVLYSNLNGNEGNSFDCPAV